MAKLMELMAYIGMCIAWLAGTVLAHGWWKLVAVFFPPYSFYLVVERIMQSSGLI